MSDVILEMHNITKEFPGVKALDNVSFNVREGEIHALVGENGAGKSTLMKTLSGVYRLDSGEICMDGKNVNIKNPRHAFDLGIRVIYQEFNLNPFTPIYENIFLGREFTNSLGFLNISKSIKIDKNERGHIYIFSKAA